MKVKTACPMDCYDGCSILAEVDETGNIKLDGNPEHPITKGALCNRGRQLSVRRNSENRVLHPLKRVGDGFVQISWEQAIAEIAQHVHTTLDEVGHHGIFHCYDWGSGTLLKNLNQRFFYGLGGCTETVGSLCWDAGLTAQTYDFGRANSHAPEDTAEHAQAIVVWGRNVANTNVHMTPFIKTAQARGAQLVVISPLAQDLGRRADKCIYPRPGTDGLLALAVLRICRDRDWLDHEFIREAALGWEEIATELDVYDPQMVASLTDVPIEDIYWLAELYGRKRPVATILGIGMQRYAQGGQTVRAIDALAAATGHVGIPGGGVSYAQRQLALFFDEEALTGRSRADVRAFERTTQATDILSADPPIRVVFVTRTNPALQVPDSALFRKAFASIRCKVVIDTFMTKTAEMADYVLPCTNVLEEEDVAYTTMWHDYVSYVRPVVEPKGEAKPDWQIFADLASALGRPDIMAGSVEAWIDMALSKWPQEKIEALKEHGFVKLDVPPVAWADRKFATPSGKFEFVSSLAIADGHHPVARIEIDKLQRGTEAYPYVLLTIHPRKWQLSQRETFPEARKEYPIVEIGLAIAHEQGIADGDVVYVENERARIQAIARVQAAGHAKSVRLEIGWSGQGVTANDFTDTRKADFGSQSAQYDCFCSIARVQEEEPSRRELSAIAPANTGQ
ncbi:anaerobic selenocysteine-containing dehydrogenase [Alicyclobacillus sacchari]|uniref:Anaerobic selenocysteine-containing dehydrogenase n=2 Tax=Alicyclobacillus sacchari TaxID=392010 RepID=A0A4V3HDU3_9BACL|nr:molybdopterin-dependent oxidoreductase [Alicyclobacillus sacchari]TDY42396.1 anaerobic selenocysteine-containing dehydrogenase [Alicyclobacillus sacchari]